MYESSRDRFPIRITTEVTKLCSECGDVDTEVLNGRFADPRTCKK